MKVAVLTSKARCEGYSDPSWIPAGTEIVHLGQEYTNDEVLKKAGDADVILVDAVLPVDRELIEHMPNLKMVHSEGVSYNRIDIEAAAERGIYACHNKAVNSGQVAEHVIMLILTVMRRFSEGEMMVRAGKQIEAKGKFIMEGLSDLIGCKVGLIGFGAIGKELAKRLAPFECELYYYDPLRASSEVEAQYNITYLEQETLFRTCDVITLHVPVTPSTEGMICTKTLAMMKPTTILINCARGAVVRDADLAEAIKNGVIYGAGLDTMDPEPVPADDPLLLLPEPYCYRVSVSPHIAGNTKGTFVASYEGFWGNVARLARGERPVNIVNGL